MPITNLPSCKNEIIQYKEDNKNRTSRKKIITAINKFTYRYRLAKSFNGAKFIGFSSRTEKGYNSGLQIMLCYSAYETALLVEELIKENKNKVIHEDNSYEKLAEQIRKNKKLEYLLKNSSNIKGKEIVEKLNEFYRNKKNNDIILIAQAIRHTFAHGEFTAGGAGLEDAFNKKTFSKIAEKILRKSDLIIRECLPELREDFVIRKELIKAEENI